MAETIGRVEFLVGLDGSRLPAEARQLGKSIGKEGDRAGKEFGESFEAALGPQLSKMSKTIASRLSANGGLAGTKLADDFATMAKKRLQQKKIDVTEALFDQHGFDNLVTRFGDVDSAVEHLRTTLAALNKENIFAKDGTWKGLVVTKTEMESLNSTIDEFADNLRNRLTPAIAETDEEFDKVEKKTSRLRTAMDKLTEGVHHQGSAWKSLSANTRQWTLIIGAVIGAMGQLASLGSAAGSGLFVLAGALSAVVTGLGLTVAAFVAFSKPIEELPEILHPARRALSDFGDAFGEVGEAMAVAAFAKTTQAWKTLAATVRGMRGPLEKVGSVIGDLVNDLAKNLAPGTDAFQDLAFFIERSGDIFGRVARLVGRLGDALLDAFANPNMQRSIDELLGWMEDLFDTFGAFLRGPGFDEWLNHGRDVFGAFGKLLGTTGDLLNDLVTDETIGMLTDFIGHIEGFLSGGGKDLLEFAIQLDIFGLIAKALDDFGKALAPLGGPMEDLANALNDVVESGIDTLAPIFEGIATALAPVVQAIADFIEANPQLVADALIAIGGAVVLFNAVKWAAIVASFKKFGGLKGLAGKAGSILAIAGAIEVLTGVFDSETDVNAGLSGLTGALAGMKFGPIGALVGTLVGLIVSMIDDVFLSPEVEGAWQKGWSQIFDPTDYSGAGIGEVKKALQDAWNEIVIWFQGITVIGEGNNPWADVANTWGLELRNFVTITLPGWWAEVTAWFGGLSLIGQGTNPIADLANEWGLAMREFFTVTLPTWWSQIVAWFQGLSLIGQGTNPIADLAAEWGKALRNFFTVTLPGWWAGIVSWFQGLSLIGKGSNPIADLAAEWGRALRNFLTVTLPNWWQGIVNFFSGKSLAGAAGGALRLPGGAGGGGGAASGRLVMNPTRLLTGEAGAEAIVPLNRPLSMVDPSVRWLSAVGQGKALPGGMGGPTTTNGTAQRMVTIAEGAIVIQASNAPEATATLTVNRIAERLAG